jgi:hypothetical protein
VYYSLNNSALIADPVTGFMTQPTSCSEDVHNDNIGRISNLNCHRCAPSINIYRPLAHLICISLMRHILVVLPLVYFLAFGATQSCDWAFCADEVCPTTANQGACLCENGGYGYQPFTSCLIEGCSNIDDVYGQDDLATSCCGTMFFSLAH